MFFHLSKIMAFLLEPLTWIVILLIISLFIRNIKTFRRFVFISFIVLYIFSNPFLADEFIRMWEVADINDSELAEVYDVGIVLGGGMITIDSENNRLTFRENVDRIMQAVRLYEQGKIKRILISGGAGNLMYRDMIESELLKDYFVTVGISSNDIVTETKSDNTYENAVNTIGILSRDFPHCSCLLITSSVHMRRAKACFLKAGREFDVFPTNKITGERRYEFSHMFLPDTDSLIKWNIFFHELFGYIIYKIMGYL